MFDTEGVIEVVLGERNTFELIVRAHRKSKGGKECVTLNSHCSDSRISHMHFRSATILG